MFLETITFFGNDVLVPVKDIKYVMAREGENGWEIVIKGQDNLEWVENFGRDENKFNIRYKMIKHILGVEPAEEILKEMNWKIGTRKMVPVLAGK